MKMGLATLPRVFDPFLQNIFCLLDELTMEVNGVFWDLPIRIILSKDEFRGLFVELFHFRSMRLSLF